MKILSQLIAATISLSSIVAVADHRRSWPRTQIVGTYERAYEREPTAEELDFWQMQLESGQNTVSQFMRIVFIHSTYQYAFGRDNTAEEFSFWDSRLANQVSFDAFRRIVFISAAFQNNCGRSNTPAEYSFWDQRLLSFGERLAAFDYVNSAVARRGCGFVRGFEDTIISER